MAELRQVRETVDQIIDLEIKSRVERIIVCLAQTYNLDREDIYRQLAEFELGLEQRRQVSQKSSTEINEDKCLGKTKYNSQCSRSRQRDSLFCGSHLHKLPYGRVDETEPVERNTNGKKRGRPRKEPSQQSLEPNDDEEIIDD